jgi:hypothetical protein
MNKNKSSALGWCKRGHVRVMTLTQWANHPEQATCKGRYGLWLNDRFEEVIIKEGK